MRSDHKVRATLLAFRLFVLRVAESTLFADTRVREPPPWGGGEAKYL